MMSGADVSSNSDGGAQPDLLPDEDKTSTILLEEAAKDTKKIDRKS